MVCPAAPRHEFAKYNSIYQFSAKRISLLKLDYICIFDMCEYGIFLVSTDIQTIESYFKKKYNISKPQ